MLRNRLVGLVEIVADARGELPRELIRRAYRASASGTIGLLLDHVSTEELDRTLNDVVRCTPGVHGVVYCTSQSLPELLSDRGVPDVVVAQSATVRKLLSGWPVRGGPSGQGSSGAQGTRRPELVTRRRPDDETSLPSI